MSAFRNDAYPDDPPRRRGCGCDTIVVVLLGLLAAFSLALAATKRRVVTSIEVDAPPEAVWRTIVDFESYPNWNPAVLWMTGEAREGAELRASIQLGRIEPFEFEAVIRTARENEELSWFGRASVPWVLDDEHSIRILPRKNGRGCRVVHSGSYRGVVPALLWWRIEAEVLHAFESHDTKLKVESEGS